MKFCIDNLSLEEVMYIKSLLIDKYYELSDGYSSNSIDFMQAKFVYDLSKKIKY